MLSLPPPPPAPTEGAGTVTLEEQRRALLSNAGSIIVSSLIVNTLTSENNKCEISQLGNTIDGESGQRLGSDVSISSDGKRIAVASSNKNYITIYDYNGGNWTQIGEDITSLGDNPVSISGDGNKVALVDSNGVSIYYLSGSTWNKLGDSIQKTGVDILPNSGINSLSLSNDGNTIAIGQAETMEMDKTNAGRLSVFKYQSSSWSRVGFHTGDAVNDKFGFSVSISSDGTVAAGGTNKQQNGYVKIYNVNVAAEPSTLDNKRVISSSVTGNFGHSISLSGDGSIIGISAYQEKNDKGAVYVYKSVNEVWTRIGDTIYGTQAGDRFGRSISLSGDGNTIAIGADGPDPPKNGANQIVGYTNIYKYNKDKNEWEIFCGSIDGTEKGGRFGNSVSINSSGGIVAVGGRYINVGSETYNGQTTIYQLTQSSDLTNLQIIGTGVLSAGLCQAFKGTIPTGTQLVAGAAGAGSVGFLVKQFLNVSRITQSVISAFAGCVASELTPRPEPEGSLPSPPSNLTAVPETEGGTLPQQRTVTGRDALRGINIVAGTDVSELTGVTLTKKGDDDILNIDNKILSKLEIDLGKGDDSIVVRGEIRNSSIDLGKGDDSIIFNNMEKINKITIKTGKGEDTIDFSGTESITNSIIKLEGKENKLIVFPEDIRIQNVKIFSVKRGGRGGRGDRISFGGKIIKYEDFKNGLEIPGIRWSFAKGKLTLNSIRNIMPAVPAVSPKSSKKKKKSSGAVQSIAIDHILPS